MGERLYDVIIIGGGPAGLSAALILGRCLRRILVFDSGKPRNKNSAAMHGFLSRDGESPLEFLRISKEQLSTYNIDILPLEVKGAKIMGNSFEVTDSNSTSYYSRKILIATGLEDEIPPIDGIEKFYGNSVFHCPYCDAFEMRFKPIAVVGYGKSGVGLALALSNWTDDILLCATNGSEVTTKEKEMLKLKNIQLKRCRIDRLEGHGGQLKKIVFNDGSFEEREALFFASKQKQKSTIASQLGCKFDTNGFIKVGKLQNTNIQGVFVAGDACKDIQMIGIAASEGLKVGIVIHKELQKEESKYKLVERFF